MAGREAGTTRAKIVKHSLWQGRRTSWYTGTSLNPQNKENFDAGERDQLLPFCR